MAAITQRSLLLDLPQDVFEVLLPHLMPVVKGQTFHPFSRTKNDPASINWRADCSALRLTCRALASHGTIKAALFHTVYVYPLNFSLDNLAALVESPLAPLVRRIVFVSPQFEEQFRDEAQYEAYTRGYVEESEWLELRNAHKEYVRGLDEQRDLLQGLKFVKCGARLISQLPKLSSVIVTAGLGGFDGGLGNDLAGGPPTFFAKRYPGAKFEDRDLDESTHCTTFLPYVLRMLSLAQITLLEFATSNGIVVAQPMEQDTWQDLRLNSLQTLRLDFESLLHGDTVSPLLRPLTRSTCNTLKTLEVSCVSRHGPGRETAVGAVLGQTFSVLEDFRIRVGTAEGLLDTASLVEFLLRHATMRRLRLKGVKLSSQQWCTVLGTLHARNMEEVELPGCRMGGSGHEWSSLSVTTRFKGYTERTVRFFADDLRLYLRGEGKWTDKLQRAFGDVDGS